MGGPGRRGGGKEEGSPVQGRGGGPTCARPMGTASSKTVQTTAGWQPGVVSDPE